MSRRIEPSRLLLTLTVLLAAAPGSLRAQSGDEDPPKQGFELSGAIGALTPLAKLADSGDSIRAELSTRLSFGAELDYWFGGGFGIGVVGGYSNPHLTVQVVQGEGAFPASINLGSVDRWVASGNLMWRPNLSGSAVVVRPYFGIGAGVTSITYPTGGDLEVSDETRFTGSVIGGAQVAISGGWFARLDVRDYISSFDAEPFQESRVQHDLVTSVVLGYAFR